MKTKIFKILFLLMIIFLLVYGTVGALYRYMVIHNSSEGAQKIMPLFPFGAGTFFACVPLGILLIIVYLFIFHREWFLSNLKFREEVFQSTLSTFSKKPKDDSGKQ